MPSVRNLVCASTLTLVLAGSVAAQYAISFKSGLINYVIGEVAVDGKAISTRSSHFPEMKADQTLQADEGRAEVLLTPGSYLRVGDHSSFKLISNSLADTKLEVVSGSAILEYSEINSDNSITILMNSTTTTFHKAGLYRFDQGSGMVRVYEGEAVVAKNSDTITLKGGRQVATEGVLAVSKFDNKVGDELYRWASRRAEANANVNMAAAKRNMAAGFTTSNWYFDPYSGFYTFLPGSGLYRSPFGFAFFSPSAYANYIYPVYNGPSTWQGAERSSYNSNYGYSTMSSRGADMGGGRAAAPAPAPTASGGAVSGARDSGGGSGGGGGGRDSGGRGR